MLDWAFIRNHTEIVHRKMKERHTWVPLQELENFDRKRRQLLQETEQLKHRRNKKNEEIIALKKQQQDTTQEIQEMKEVREDFNNDGIRDAFVFFPCSDVGEYCPFVNPYIRLLNIKILTSIFRRNTCIK